MPYFYFPWAWTSVIHSFKSKNRVFFFSAKRKKKYKLVFFVFFFPRKSSSVIHSDFDEFHFFLKLVVFFFPHFCVFFCVFFFPRKSLIVIHSFVFFWVKKNEPEKKTAFSFIHSIIIHKNAQKLTFPGE